MEADKLILLPASNAPFLDSTVNAWNHETGEINKISEDISQLQ
jgi:hypothetical protein